MAVVGHDGGPRGSPGTEERFTLYGGGRPRWMRRIIMIVEPRKRERGSRCMAAVVQDCSASSMASPPPSRVSCSVFPITGNSQGARPVFRAKTLTPPSNSFTLPSPGLFARGQAVLCSIAALQPFLLPLLPLSLSPLLLDSGGRQRGSTNLKQIQMRGPRCTTVWLPR